MQLYLSFIENEIKKFYNTLPEKAKRLYTAVEALKNRAGHFYTQKVIKTFDHDFISFAKGIIIP